MPELTTLIIALVAAGSAGISAFVTGIFSRRKSGADAAATLTSASIELVETLREEVDELRAEQDILKGELDKLRADLAVIEDLADNREAQIVKLKKRIDEADRIIEVQEKRIAALEKILRLHGIDPIHDEGDIGGVVF